MTIIVWMSGPTNPKPKPINIEQIGNVTSLSIKVNSDPETRIINIPSISNTLVRAIRIRISIPIREAIIPNAKSRKKLAELKLMLLSRIYSET